LTALAFAALCVALAKPQYPYTLPEQTVRARDIVIAVDKSGSMGETFEGQVPPPLKGNTQLDRELPALPKMLGPGDSDYPHGTPYNMGHRRIDAAQSATLNFIRDRFAMNSGDRVGVLVFDTRPYWAWPLTRDLKTIYRELQFTTTTPGGGTNFGQVDPGPIDAAVEQFGELGQSSTRVVIMVTDGEDDLSASAKDRLVQQLRSNGIHLYVIGVGPILAHQNVDIIQVAAAVGGQVFRVENAGDMQKCFETINTLEQSPVKIPGAKRKLELFWYFAGPALALFLLGAICDALVLRR
jgi:Ca-activated chloride channel family protein